MVSDLSQHHLYQPRRGPGQLVGPPGAGCGKNGEGFFRLTAFGGAGSTVEAAQRLLKLK